MQTFQLPRAENMFNKKSHEKEKVNCGHLKPTSVGTYTVMNVPGAYYYYYYYYHYYDYDYDYDDDDDYQ